jgi:hypothetical protein
LKLVTARNAVFNFDRQLSSALENAAFILIVLLLFFLFGGGRWGYSRWRGCGIAPESLLRRYGFNFDETVRRSPALPASESALSGSHALPHTLRLSSRPLPPIGSEARRDALLDEAVALLNGVVQVRRCSAATMPTQLAGLFQFGDGAGTRIPG